ncbi:MAG: hypothetical protein QW356_05955 [Candidatus Hadarchaeales archaeon]
MGGNMKCKFCNRKALFFIPPKTCCEEIIYVCEEHARKMLLSNRAQIAPKIGLEKFYVPK